VYRIEETDRGRGRWYGILTLIMSAAQSSCTPHIISEPASELLQALGVNQADESAGLHLGNRTIETSSNQSTTLTLSSGPETRSRCWIRSSPDFAYLQSTLH
jgi:hypothetical protein